MLHTTTYLLPYPEGTDDMCHVADVVAEAAGIVGAELTRLEAGLQGLLNDIVVRVSTLATPTSSDYPKWTSVDIDPTGTANLIDDAYSILLPVLGEYLVGGSLDVSTSGTAGNNLQFVSDTYDVSYRDLGTPAYPAGYSGCSAQIVGNWSVSPTPIRTYLSAYWQGAGAPAEATVVKGYMYIVRLCDIP